MALSCKVPAALPLHVVPSFFNPSFLLGYLLFLLYLAPYHWSWEASLSALWNCVFSKFTCHVCTLISVKKHLPGHASKGQNRGGEWGGHWDLPVKLSFPLQLTWGWKAKWTSLNKRWGDQRVDWKLLAVFSWVASGRVVYLGFCLTHISKCLSEWRD